MQRVIAARTPILLRQAYGCASALSLRARPLPSHACSALHTHSHPRAAAAVAAVSTADDDAGDAPTPAPRTSPKKPKKSSLKVGPSVALPGWELIVGLEVHAQITARSKLFSAAGTRFGAPPNSQASPVDAAMPGTLPVLNAHAVAQAARTGLGLGGDVQRRSTFERKHYFYCDMPQGYQITQQQYPIVRGGALVLDSLLRPGDSCTVRITRIQLEQDSGKNLHDLHPQRTYVDLNRAGVGLMEIVSEPDMRSSEQAAAYVRKLTSLLQHLGTCRAHMEDGSLRCDVNISVRRTGTQEYGERVEVKNLNSIRSLQRAIEHEYARQVALAERGEAVKRETRSFDAKTGHTVLLRTKEQMLDYRFLPEPDLPPLILAPQELDSLRSAMPELPDAIAERFASEYGLSQYDVGVLGSEEGASAFLDALVYGPQGRVVDATTGKVTSPQLRRPKTCANWLTSELFGRLKKLSAANKDAPDAAEGEEGTQAEEDAYNPDDVGSFSGAGSRAPTLAASPVSPVQLGELIDLVENGGISGRSAKDLLDALLVPGETRGVAQLVQDNGWAQVLDMGAVEAACQATLAKFPAEVIKAREGDKRRFGFLAGQALKLGAQQGKGGQLNPAAVSKRMAELVAASSTEASGSSTPSHGKGSFHSPF